MEKRPNILIFMTDHQRRETMPGYGWCHAPNLAAFAKDSIQFDNAVCTAPHCCPSRASFFTGLYPSDHGVWNNVVVGNTLSRGLAAGVRTWSEDLKDSGYRMFFSGKWHVSAEESPAERGFTVLYDNRKYSGFHRSDADRVPDTHEWERYEKGLCDVSAPRRPGEIKREGYPEYFLYGKNEQPFNDQLTVDAAVRQLNRLDEGEGPWCMYVGTLGPHDPYCVPQKFLDMYDPDSIRLPENFHDDMQDKPALYRRTQRRYAQLTEKEQREALRHYLAFCSYEDALFGQVLDALRQNGLYDDSVILYLSDHGDYAGAHGLWAKGLPCFREAYDVPLMVHMPGGRAGRNSYPVCLTDIAPTILEMCGISAEHRMQGVSLMPLLTGTGEMPERPYRFTQSNGNELYGIQRAVYSDKWKYVFNGFDDDELYDLENDPGELHNLAQDPQYAGVIRMLCRELWMFARENHDTILNPYIMTALAPYGPGIICGKND